MPSRRVAFGVLGLGLIIASCVGRDLPTDAAGEAGLVRLDFQPALIPSPADGSALPIHRIRAIVRRVSDNTLLLDRSVDVTPTDATWTLDLAVPLVAGSAQARVIVFLVNVATDGTAQPQFSGQSGVLDLVPGAPRTAVDLPLVRGPLANLFTTSLAITAPPIAIAVGAGVNLQASVTADPSPPLPLIFWTSLAPSILGMNGARATGVAVGTARVVASAGAFADTVSIDVFVPPVDSVRVSPDSTDVTVGAIFPYTATLLDASGNVLKGRLISWSTENPAIATVSTTGVVTGVAPGTTSLAATSEGVSDNAVVRVVVPPFGGGPNITWTRSGSGAWSDPTAWDLGRIPQQGDTVRLTQGVDYTVTLDVDATVGALVIGGTADVIRLAVGDRSLWLTGTGAGPELTILPLGGIQISNGTLNAPDIINQGLLRTDGAATIVATTVMNYSTWRVSAGAQLLGVVPGVDFYTEGTLTIDAGAGLTLAGGSSLTYGGGTIDGGGLLSFLSGSTLTLEQDLVLDGPFLSLQQASIRTGSADRLTLELSSALFMASMGGLTDVEAKVVNRGSIHASGSAILRDSLYLYEGAVVVVDGSSGTSSLCTGGVESFGQIVLTGANAVRFGPGSAAQLTNRPGGVIQTSGSSANNLDGEVINEGVLIVSGPTELRRQAPNALDVTAHHVSSGTIELLGGDLALVLGGASPTFTNSGTIIVGDLTTLSVTNLATPAGAIVNGATGVLNGTGTVRFNPGTSGNPDPSGVNNGVIAPGRSPGRLTWQGLVPMGPTGVIEIEISGKTPGSEYDQLEASADLVLDLNAGAPTGTLAVTAPGFTPVPGERFAVLTFRARFGNFATVTLPSIPGITLDTVWAEGGTADTLYIQATASGPAPANLSWWAHAASGNWSSAMAKAGTWLVGGMVSDVLYSPTAKSGDRSAKPAHDSCGSDADLRWCADALLGLDHDRKRQRWPRAAVARTWAAPSAAAPTDATYP